MQRKLSTVQDLTRQLAGRAETVPDYTELFDTGDEAALVDAYICQNLTDDARAELRSLSAVNDADERDSDTLCAALPETLRGVLRTYQERACTMRWIREEVAFALGVEIGRRLR